MVRVEAREPGAGFAVPLGGGKWSMMHFLLWLILFVVYWPVALVALLLYPLVWLLLLPFRLVGITVDAVFSLLHAVLMFPARALRMLTGSTSK